MNKYNGYSGNNLNRDRDPFDRFIHGTIPWKKSREEVWQEIESAIDTKTEPVIRKIRVLWIRYAAAAIVLVLFGISSFLRFHTKTYSTAPGQQSEIILPDGSEINLNSGTTLKFHPYWWKISKKVELEGEAFFEVQEGKKFEIISELGRTIVLGTSFNILAGENIYEVTCLTGKVRIIASATGNEAFITKNQKASLAPSGVFDIAYESNVMESTAWTRGEFSFTSVPLEEVFRKIEISYGITINYQKIDTLIYTGYFKKDDNVENILNLVCMAFGINFEETSDKVYQITHNE